MVRPAPNSASTAEVLTVEVQRGGRQFPQRTPATGAAPRHPLRHLRDDRTEIHLWERLREGLAESLTWSTLDSAPLDRAGLVQTYITTLNQLGARRRELEAMLRATGEAQLEFRQESGQTHSAARDAALARQWEKLFAEAIGTWPAPRNILDAALVSQALPPLRARLESAVADEVDRFAQELLALLARLVDRGQVGLVEWHPNHCCSYHFFRQVVIQHRGPDTTRETGRTLQRDPDRAARTTVVGLRTVAEIAGGHHEYRLARHEHEVMQAIRTSVGNSRVVRPRGVAQLLAQVPAWLAPCVEIIDGQIFRERIIERDAGTEDWTAVTVHDEPLFGRDPAIIIGPYVLVGWGPREIEQELRRQAGEAARVADAPAPRPPLWLALTRTLFGPLS